MLRRTETKRRKTERKHGEELCEMLKVKFFAKCA